MLSTKYGCNVWNNTGLPKSHGQQRIVKKCVSCYDIKKIQMTELTHIRARGDNSPAKQQQQTNQPTKKKKKKKQSAIISHLKDEPHQIFIDVNIEK